MKIFKNHFSFNLILALLIIMTGIFAGYSIIAQAQIDKITFPVAELGNCTSEEECKDYCDEEKNMPVCIDFAEKNGLMSTEDAKRARVVTEIGEGPGGCKNKEECETYCNSTSHMNECLAFAEEHDLMLEEELEEAKKVAAALREGAELPGGCKNKEECETYCNDMSHINECLAFAEKAGLIPEDELEDAKKAAKAMASGLTPPGNCRNKKDCESYCSEESHMEECMNFAVTAGFIPKEEVEEARKMMSLMKSGNTPGGCKGKEECENYCSDSSHMEECMNFAKEAGLVSEEEIERMKQSGMENMGEGMNKMKEMINNAPPEVSECLKANLGPEIIEKIRSSDFSSVREDVGETMRKCFENYHQTRGGEEIGGIKDYEYRLPEGVPIDCKSQEECASYYNQQNFEGYKNYEQQYQQQYHQQYYEQKSPDYYNQEIIDKNYNYIPLEGTSGYPTQYYPQPTTDINTYIAPNEIDSNTYTNPPETAPTETTTNLGSNLYRALLKLISR